MKSQILAVVGSLSSALVTLPCHAAYIINIEQAGSGVVASGSGSFDLEGLTFAGPGAVSPDLTSATAYILIGSGNSVDFYSGFNGPSNFGAGLFAVPSSNSGPLVGHYFSYIPYVFGDVFSSFLAVPTGYISRSELDPSISTYTNTTLAQLGLNEGSYQFTWGTGADVDSLTINVGLSSVPLPASAPMFGAALMALGAIGYGMKRKKAAAAA